SSLSIQRGLYSWQKVITPKSVTLPHVTLPRHLSKHMIGFGCGGENGNDWGLAMFTEDESFESALQVCEKHVMAPVEMLGDEGSNRDVDYLVLLRRGFRLKWAAINCSECAESGGHCGFDVINYKFECFCTDRPHASSCPPTREGEMREGITRWGIEYQHQQGESSGSQPIEFRVRPMTAASFSAMFSMFHRLIFNIVQLESKSCPKSFVVEELEPQVIFSDLMFYFESTTILPFIRTTRVVMPLAYSVINQEQIKDIVFQLAIFLQIHHSPSEPNSTDFLDLLTPSFTLDWNCKAKRSLGLILGTVFSCIGVVILLFICLRKKVFWHKNIRFWETIAEDHRNIEAFLKNFGSYAPKRYNYADIKRITSHFNNKLGQGGFGNVYRGSLRNGSQVAVKVLNELKGNGEDFINEVASISRTSHVNIVSLVGFCFEGHKRALIYDFMPNGSLEKFIYEERSNGVRQLGWPILYKIALGIAQGLEYLHRGCNTRILHFDIKPHNILLDEDFCPKISDFGLAKLCIKKESIVSMLGPRGTIGYIAPEVVCRNLGGVSHKSEVYSYGMMVLEMVGGRKNVDVGVDRTSEIYFPHWLYR
ncbi:hypothetical protein H5410_025369, partial [Solanum commersonii]